MEEAYIVETAHNMLIYVKTFYLTEDGFLFGTPCVVQTKRQLIHATFAFFNLKRTKCIRMLPPDREDTDFKHFKGFKVKNGEKLQSLNDLVGKEVNVMSKFGDFYSGLTYAVKDSFVFLTKATVKKPVWVERDVKVVIIPIETIEYVYGGVLAREQIKKRKKEVVEEEE